MVPFDETGEGPSTIVFLHAALGDRRMWHRQWSHFDASYRLLRFDLCGFGEHRIPDHRVNNAEMISDVLDDKKIERTVLVGASMGGRVAMELALLRPDLVAGLALFGSALPGHDWSQAVQNVWADEAEALEAGDLDRAVDINLTFWLDGPTREAARVSEADRALVATMQRTAFENELATPDAPGEAALPGIADRLGEIDAPTRIVFGEHDVSDIGAIARRLAGAIPGATLVEIADAAHLPFLEAPAECNRIIDELAAAVLA